MRTIDAGQYIVRVRCPNCDTTAELTAELTARLTVEDEHTAIAVRVRTKAAPHHCNRAAVRRLVNVPLPGMPDDDDAGEAPQ